MILAAAVLIAQLFLNSQDHIWRNGRPAVITSESVAGVVILTFLIATHKSGATFHHSVILQFAI